MNLTYRAADEGDVAVLLQLYQQLSSGHSALSESRLRELIRRIATYPDYTVYLALDGDQVVGTFALLIMDALGDRLAPAGVVEDVVVDSAVRGRGIGKAMMKFALEKCRNAGCYKMALSSNINRPEAHRFYESLGFEKHGYSFLVTLRRE
jgi:GNAT superfamily N-acetyltransferase